MKHGARVVSLGGGTGMAALLAGLKRYVVPAGRGRNIEALTAVVAVTDDGGSSGRLRDEFQILPPGDIRNCIVALSDHTALLSRLFQFRFNGNGQLAGHSMGNLLLTALTSVQGDFIQAIKAASDVLAIKGTIYPATTHDVRLVADMADGTRVRGESAISRAGSNISTVRLEPADCEPLPETLKALRAADIITIGPGSLFTSIIPNLLVPGVAVAIRGSRAIKVFICNVMTQPGETPGFTASDHLRRVMEICGPGLVDVALVNSALPTPAVMRRYKRDGAEPVAVDLARFRQLGVGVHACRVLSEEAARHGAAGRIVRHDSAKLALQILSLGQQGSKRRPLALAGGRRG